MTEFRFDRRLTVLCCGAALFLLLFPTACAGTPESDEASTYPKTRTVDQVDVYHGVEVADPYRWLEAMESAEVRSWVEAQNAVSVPHLASIPQRDRIERRLTELWNYERCRIPEKRGGRVFFRHNEGLAGQDALYVIEGRGPERRLLLDPNRIPTEAENDTLVEFVPSVTGRYVAYALSPGGSDWITWRILEVDTGETLGDEVRWSQAGYEMGWVYDDSGFYYNRFDPPNEGGELSQQHSGCDVYFHRLGTSQQEDALAHPRSDAEGVALFFGDTTLDGRFLILTSWDMEMRTEVSVVDLQVEPQDRVATPLIEGFDAFYRVLAAYEGDYFLVVTNLDAPNWRIVAVDRREPQRENWRVVVPEGESLISNNLVGDRLIVTHLKDVLSEVRVYALDGTPQGTVDLDVGTVTGFAGTPGDETYYSLTSFTEPQRIVSYNARTGTSERFFDPQVSFDPDHFETRQVFFESRDGTRVPMFLSHRKGIALDGSNPTFLTGYGAYGIPYRPLFFVPFLTWMEMGGVLAVANVRGGGEYGDDWHKAGSGRNKQNAIDDMITAAEWLCARRYTSREKLALHGRSAGGLLIAACLTQRPDLFGGVVAEVPVTDMLRSIRFTSGAVNAIEHGTPDDPEDFLALHGYSPLHHVRPGTTYPPTLLLTYDRDERVAPFHSYKFAAALQAAQEGPAPILLRMEADRSHSGPLQTKSRIRGYADVLAFLCEALDFEPRWENE